MTFAHWLLHSVSSIVGGLAIAAFLVALGKAIAADFHDETESKWSFYGLCALALCVSGLLQADMAFGLGSRLGLLRAGGFGAVVVSYEAGLKKLGNSFLGWLSLGLGVVLFIVAFWATIREGQLSVCTEDPAYGLPRARRPLARSSNRCLTRPGSVTAARLSGCRSEVGESAPATLPCSPLARSRGEGHGRPRGRSHLALGIAAYCTIPLTMPSSRTAARRRSQPTGTLRSISSSIQLSMDGVSAATRWARWLATWLVTEAITA